MTDADLQAADEDEAASNAIARSARRSSTASMPTEARISAGGTANGESATEA